MTDKKVLERSMRSVFVGNIPYDATEEKLKEIFSEVGPVVLFKLVYDKETGKPKGYGFCEYNDQETALSAMRNLSGFEIGGRALRVDNACTEKSKMEMQSLMSGMPPASENHFGEPVAAEKAPEVISNIVSSIPPEQLYELMKQMKECVQNNPLEARNMLLRNPQLGYALLQAQVKMKIVDPEVAKTMLYPTHEVPSLPNALNAVFTSQGNSTSYLPGNNNQWNYTNPQMVGNPPFHPNWYQMNRGPDMNIDFKKPPNQAQFFSPPSMPFEPSQLSSRNYPQLSVPMDLNNHSFGNTNLMATSLPSMNFIPPVLVSETKMPPRTFHIDQPQQLPSQTSTDNDEKAALILEVMQLTDAQIAMLPNEQRQSILALKEKISGSSLEKN